jgi:hypothetical protein
VLTSTPDGSAYSGKSKNIPLNMNTGYQPLLWIGVHSPQTPIAQIDVSAFSSLLLISMATTANSPFYTVEKLFILEY